MGENVVFSRPSLYCLVIDTSRSLLTGGQGRIEISVEEVDFILAKLVLIVQPPKVERKDVVVEKLAVVEAKKVVVFDRRALAAVGGIHDGLRPLRA